MQVSTAGFVSEERAGEIEKFFSENPWPVAARIVKQNCEAIRLNAKWLQRDRDIVKEWLASQWSRDCMFGTAETVTVLTTVLVTLFNDLNCLY